MRGGGRAGRVAEPLWGPRPVGQSPWFVLASSDLFCARRLWVVAFSGGPMGQFSGAGASCRPRTEAVSSLPGSVGLSMQLFT